MQDALDELGVSGLNVTEVMGCGRQKGYTEQYRGSQANISLLPKLKVESVVLGATSPKGGRGDRRRRLHRRDRRRPHLRVAVVRVVRIRTGERGVGTVTRPPSGWGY